jgi:catechol 2,3-dioxygenase-like lactoylglutathione lyase family enzyme
VESGEWRVESGEWREGSAYTFAGTFDRRLMQITRVIPQLRTTDLAASLAFYTGKLGFDLLFLYDDFYAAVQCGPCVLHLKLVDERDPSIDFVAHGGHFHLYVETADVAATADELRKNGVKFICDVHETAWSTRECIIEDNAGHTLYFGQQIG